jgi:hypothetical protein
MNRADKIVLVLATFVTTTLVSLTSYAQCATCLSNVSATGTVINASTSGYDSTGIFENTGGYNAIFAESTTGAMAVYAGSLAGDSYAVEGISNPGTYSTPAGGNGLERRSVRFV